MPTREQYLAEAQKRGLIPNEQREQQYGTISAKPGFLESSLPMAGQIAGGFLGAKGGVPGAVIGATGGAMAGRLGQQAFRRARGEEITPAETAKELGGEALITGAAETAFPAASRFLGPVVKPIASKIWKKAARPAIENVFRFMTGISPESTQRLLERGPEQILTRKMRSREKGIRIAEDFLKGAKKAHKIVNAEWESTVGPLRKLGTSSVEAEPIRDAARMAESEFAGAEGPVLKSVKDVFSTLHGVVGDVKELTMKPKFISQTREAVSPILKETGQPFTSEITERVAVPSVAKKLSLDKAISARQQLDDVIYAGKAQGLLTPRQSVALKDVRSSISNEIHSAFPEIAQVDEQKHVLSKASKVIERFSPESVTNVDRLGKMIDSFEDISPAVREAIQKADSVISKNTGNSLLDLIRDRAAAKAFEPTELRAVRTWLIGAVLGALGLGAGGPIGGAAATGLGLTLSSPRLVGETIKATQTIGRGASQFLKKAIPLGAAQAGRETFLPEKK